MEIRMKKNRRAAAAAAAAAALLLAMPTSAGAATGSASPWRSYPVPVGGQAVLDAVTAPAANDAWAGGFTLGADGFSPLMLHWSGRAWLTVSVPDSTRIDQLSSTGSEDVWAMTDDQPLHWNGTRWVAEPVESVPDMSQGGDLAADGPHDAWYTGETFDPVTGVSSSFVEEWDGRAWKLVPLPAGLAADSLADVAADGPHDVWVDGTTATGTIALAHWDGSRWTTVPVPATGFAYTTLSQLMMIKPGDVWLVGWGETVDETGAVRDSLLMHWNGRAWSISPVPSGSGELYAAAKATNGLWAVGDTYHAPGVPYAAYLLHETRAGWAQVATPTAQDAGFDAITAIPGGGIWVVGATTYDTTTNSQVAPLLMRYPIH